MNIRIATAADRSEWLRLLLYVESWFVDADLRGTGAGRALMAAAEQWARDRNYTELASDALLDNTGSHAAHRALGFEEVERVVHFRKPL